MSAVTASAMGPRMMASMTAVMIATAKLRRPPRRRSTHRISGQVATTIMTAQITAGRNGLSTQKLAAIKPPIATTAKRIRVMSQGSAVSFMRRLS
jgi:hypothetical protein